jgi:type I restriction enzyme S subunit
MSNKMKTTATKEDGKPALVPKLRFPEFRDAPGWQEMKIDDLFYFQDGFAFKSTDFVKSKEDATQVIRITDINNWNTNEDKVYIPNAFLESNNLDRYFVHDGELLLSLTGAAGFNFFFWDGGRSVINQRTAKVTPKKKSDSALARLLEPLIHEKINIRGEGQNNNLSKEFLSSVILLIPQPPEQQKIAECLSSVDELIAAQARKLDALKTHKIGLMQQLFPREGETQPRLRFPEFQNAGEWEEHQLSKLTTKISDGIHTTPIYDENGEYAFINGNNLVSSRILIDEKTKRVNSVEFNKHKKPLDDNSILMSINGTIGNLAFYSNEQVILGKSACFINIDERLVNKFFIYNLLQTEGVNKFFNSELTGSTIKNLSLTTIKNLELKTPSLPEQQRIADCLTSLDDLITAQIQKLEALKTHKKGLMQQLFPSPEEVEA